MYVRFFGRFHLFVGYSNDKRRKKYVMLMYMPPKKKPNLQQQKTKKREQDLIKLNQKADLFRQTLAAKKPVMDLGGNILPDKITENDINKCVYSI